MEKKKYPGEGLPCRVHTRLTRQKYEELCALLEEARSIHSLSELLRHILDNKTIVVKKVDITMDKIMNELAAIRKELLAIGININQVTRAFHQMELPRDKLAEANKFIAFSEETDRKIVALFNTMDKLSEKWSQE